MRIFVLFSDDGMGCSQTERKSPMEGEMSKIQKKERGKRLTRI